MTAQTRDIMLIQKSFTWMAGTEHSWIVWGVTQDNVTVDSEAGRTMQASHNHGGEERIFDTRYEDALEFARKQAEPQGIPIYLKIEPGVFLKVE